MALRAALLAATLTLALVPAAHAACVYPSQYPGETAPRDKVAAWMAGGATARGIPGELPVMAALVESGMTNLKGGDSDSRGYFAMRTAIWDSGEYAGYPDNPPLQLKWFVDQALKYPARDEPQWGEWVADVQRPAAQYRYRYQLRLDEARGLIASGCQVPDDQVPAGTTPAPDPDPGFGEPEPGDTPAATAPRLILTGAARQRVLRQRGVRLALECTAACRAEASGRVLIGRTTYKLTRVVLDMSPGRPFAVRLAPNPRALAGIRTALATGKRVTAVIEARVGDDAPQRLTVRLVP